MQILIYTLCAAGLVSLGAVLSGGWQPFARGAARRGNGAGRTPRSGADAAPPEDDFGRDLAALLRYGAETAPTEKETQTDEA